MTLQHLNHQHSHTNGYSSSGSTSTPKNTSTMPLTPPSSHVAAQAWNHRHQRLKGTTKRSRAKQQRRLVWAVAAIMLGMVLMVIHVEVSLLSQASTAKSVAQGLAYHRPNDSLSQKQQQRKLRDNRHEKVDLPHYHSHRRAEDEIEKSIEKEAWESEQRLEDAGDNHAFHFHAHLPPPSKLDRKQPPQKEPLSEKVTIPMEEQHLQVKQISEPDVKYVSKKEEGVTPKPEEARKHQQASTKQPQQLQEKSTGQEAKVTELISSGKELPQTTKDKTEKQQESKRSQEEKQPAKNVPANQQAKKEPESLENTQQQRKQEEATLPAVIKTQQESLSLTTTKPGSKVGNEAKHAATQKDLASEKTNQEKADSNDQQNGAVENKVQEKEGLKEKINANSDIITKKQDQPPNDEFKGMPEEARKEEPQQQPKEQSNGKPSEQHLGRSHQSKEVQDKEMSQGQKSQQENLVGVDGKATVSSKQSKPENGNAAAERQGTEGNQEKGQQSASIINHNDKQNMNTSNTKEHAGDAKPKNDSKQQATNREKQGEHLHQESKPHELQSAKPQEATPQQELKKKQATQQETLPQQNMPVRETTTSETQIQPKKVEQSQAVQQVKLDQPKKEEQSQVTPQQKVSQPKKEEQPQAAQQQKIAQPKKEEQPQAVQQQNLAETPQDGAKTGPKPEKEPTQKISPINIEDNDNATAGAENVEAKKTKKEETTKKTEAKSADGKGVEDASAQAKLMEATTKQQTDTKLRADATLKEAPSPPVEEHPELAKAIAKALKTAEGQGASKTVNFCDFTPPSSGSTARVAPAVILLGMEDTSSDLMWHVLSKLFPDGSINPQQASQPIEAVQYEALNEMDPIGEERFWQRIAVKNQGRWIGEALCTQQAAKSAGQTSGNLLGFPWLTLGDVTRNGKAVDTLKALSGMSKESVKVIRYRRNLLDMLTRQEQHLLELKQRQPVATIPLDHKKILRQLTQWKTQQSTLDQFLQDNHIPHMVVDHETLFPFNDWKDLMNVTHLTEEFQVPLNLKIDYSRVPPDQRPPEPSSMELEWAKLLQYLQISEPTSLHDIFSSAETYLRKDSVFWTQQHSIANYPSIQVALQGTHFQPLLRNLVYKHDFYGCACNDKEANQKKLAWGGWKTHAKAKK